MIKQVYLSVILWLVGIFVYGKQFETCIADGSGDIIITNTRVVADPLYPNVNSFSPLWVKLRGISDQLASGHIILSYEGTPLVAGSTVEVSLNVVAYYEDGTSFSSSRKLNINRNQNGVTTDDYLQDLVFNDVYRLDYTLTDIKHNGINIPALPQGVTLGACIRVERVFTMSKDQQVSGFSITENTTDNTIELNWNEVSFAESYDLEWTYINNYRNNGGQVGSVSPSDLYYDFSKNSNRVNITNNSYALSKVFGRGYVLFRIRAVGQVDLTENQPYVAQWSCETVGGCSGNITGLYYLGGGQFALRIDEANVHRETLNWGFNASYAEEGKRKEVVEYADGIGKYRQSVTRLPSVGEAVVAETVYDNYGRPIVSTIPAPTGSNRLGFYENFNVNQDNKPLHFTDFQHPVNSCITNGIALSDQSGAANYFSELNPDKSNENAYIPDANGFVYTQIEYTSDKTGRIAKQAGSGEVFAMGAGKEVVNLYSQPLQIELDRLFGSNVGKASHYKKLLTTDANGQKSTVFTNLSGTTIATALVGQSPNNVTPLESHPTDSPIEADILMNQRSETALNSFLQLAVVEDNDYTFHYDVTASMYQNLCSDSSVCFHCPYELVLDMQDDCGNRPALQGGLTLPLAYQIGSISQVCEEMTPFEIDFTTSLTQGEYTVSKILRISEDSIRRSFDIFLTEDTCITTYREFVGKAIASIRMGDCSVDNCEEDCDKLKRSGAGIEEILACKLACHESVCGSIKEIMLTDISPGGQYAVMDSLPLDGNGNPDFCYEGENNQHGHGSYQTPSVLCVNNAPYKNYTDFNTYVDENGNPALVITDQGDSLAPEELSPAQFVKYWQDSWGETLLQAHVEYNCWVECTNLDASRNYEDLLIMVSSYQEAYVLGLLNPLGLVDADEPNLLVPVSEFGETPVPGLAIDPFFELAGTTEERTLMLNYLKNYELEDEEGELVSYTIWELAAILSNCPTTPNEEVNATCVSTVLANLTDYYPETLEACMNDDIWTFFRALYLAKRTELFHLYQKNICNVTYFELENEYEVFTGKTQRFIDPELAFNSQMSGVDLFASSGNDRKKQVSDAEGMVDASNYSSCDSVCSFYIPYWMEKIGECDTVQGMLESPWNETNATYNELLEKLQEVCVAGCDLDHLTGSSTIPENHPGVPSDREGVSNYRSFEDVFLAIIGNPYLACNATLITMPMPYGYTYEEQNEQNELDACACSSILNGQKAMDDSLCMPAYITTLEEYFEFNYETNIPNIAKLSCLCSEAYTTDTGEETWNPDVPFTSEADNIIAALSLGKYHIDGKFTCSPCYSCEELDTLMCHFYADLEVVYGLSLPVENSQRKVVNTMLLNTLSASLNMMVDNDMLSFIMDKCDIYDYSNGNGVCGESTGNGSNGGEGDNLPVDCEPIDPHIHAITNFVNGLIGEGDIDNKACLCPDPYGLISELFNFGYHNLYMVFALDNQFDPEDCDQTYRFQDVENDVFKGKVFDNKGNECELGLYFDDLSAGYNISNIELIKNVRPDYEEEETQNYFIADAEIWHDGEIKTVLIHGYYSCLMMYKCGGGEGGDGTPIGSGGSSSSADNCVRFRSFHERYFDNPVERCKTEKMEQAYYQAKINYKQYTTSLYPDFREKYLNSCLQPQSEAFSMAFNTKEHHYTLYYYDKVGNVIKTIPPEGVMPITDENTLNLIKTNRKNGVVQEIHPDHGLATVYEYNSLNQLVRQYMPDHNSFDEEGLTTQVNLRDKYHSQRFWYDALGRLVSSQSSKQAGETPPRYSYTKFDELGRMVEVGVLASNTQPTAGVLNHALYPNNWVSGKRYEVTKTYYDKPLNSIVSNQFGGNGQVHLRNRVATAAFYSEYNPILTTSDDFETATHYSYDFHGNVKTLIQDISALKSFGRYKHVDYDYDLISGNVKQVAYQKGKKDAFYHRYAYDEDNRIVSTETSKDGALWETDASYQYYKHGPLSRTTLGQHEVQGLDYAYTMQGWLKSINGYSIASSEADMGNDGSVGSNVASDVFALGLNYYTNDYSPIQADDPQVANKFPEATTEQNNVAPNLFNGNIKQQVISMHHTETEVPESRTYAYQYDQLNRLTNMQAFVDVPNGGTPTDPMEYHTAYSYDANGNLNSLLRNGSSDQLSMDNLTYRYQTDPTTGKIVSNKLYSVNDAVAANAYTTDIDDQGVFDANDASSWNYDYDAIGNLIKDKTEEIAEIQWTQQGKVAAIIREANSTKPNLFFAYDATGNRIMKLVKPRDGQGDYQPEETWNYTWYVRDASGNVMATYDQTLQEEPGGSYAELLHINEWNLYGSARLGLRKPGMDEALQGEAHFESGGENSDGSYLRQNYVVGNPNGGGSGLIDLIGTHTAQSGLKQYELNNHLGNVMAVVSDKKTLLEVNPTIFAQQAEVISATGYYPFGMIMPGRSFASNGYKYGFNGMEKDDEVSGSGNSYTAEYWQYDSRLGRRWNVDVVPKYNESSYATFSNNPIWLVDPSGADTAVFNADNKYSHVIKAEGTNVGQKLGDDGFVFNFADPVNDMKSIEKGEISELYIPTTDEILKDLDNAGVNDEANRGMIDGAVYLYENSHAGSNSGKTDFVMTSEMHGSTMFGDIKMGGYQSNKLYITKVDGKMLAHNSSNFGNFMWGASAKALDVGILTALSGAHINNYLNDKHNRGKPWYDRDFDTKDDQFSITLGYLWQSNQK
jgi:hypothetical protein